MCMGVLSSCMFVYHMQSVPLEVRRGHLIPRNWSEIQLLATIWVLGTKRGSLEEQLVFLAAEPPLQYLVLFFETQSQYTTQIGLRLNILLSQIPEFQDCRCVLTACFQNIPTTTHPVCSFKYIVKIREIIVGT